MNIGEQGDYDNDDKLSDLNNKQLTVMTDKPAPANQQIATNTTSMVLTNKFSTGSQCNVNTTQIDMALFNPPNYDFQTTFLFNNNSPLPTFNGSVSLNNDCFPFFYKMNNDSINNKAPFNNNNTEQYLLTSNLINAATQSPSFIQHQAVLYSDIHHSSTIAFNSELKNITSSLPSTSYGINPSSFTQTQDYAPSRGTPLNFSTKRKKEEKVEKSQNLIRGLPLAEGESESKEMKKMAIHFLLN